jgi:hypothetical protein
MLQEVFARLQESAGKTMNYPTGIPNDIKVLFKSYLKGAKLGDQRRWREVCYTIDRHVEWGFIVDKMMIGSKGLVYAMDTGRLNSPVFAWIRSRSINQLIDLLHEICEHCHNVGEVPFYLNALNIVNKEGAWRRVPQKEV